MDEGYFFFGGIFLVFFALIVGTTIYNVNELHVKEKLVAGGANPLDVRCMFASKEDAICLTAKR